mgnify:CR=1 FL=1
MTLAEALSKRVNELLESNKITQYQLFKLSGVPQTTISDVRNMKNGTVNIRIIYEIAQGFEMDLIDFFNSPLFKRENITD